MFRDKTGEPLKNLLESQGEDRTVEIIKESLDEGKLHPDDFSLREIWEACNPGISVQEAVVSSAFPKITGELINSKIISSYDSVNMIGDDLCTTVSSNVEQETVAGFTEAETPEEVGENGEYKDSTIAEKYVTGRNKKYGRLLSITEEMVYFDKTGQVLDRARRIGMKAAQYKEKLIVEGVQDVNSNVYQPSGTATAFHASAYNNIITSNPFGESGLEEVMKTASMMKDDSEGADNADFIMIDTNNMTVLVPNDLLVESWQMANSTKTPESNENADNYFRGRFKVLTSPFVTNQSTTTWYAGNPKEDFWWTEVWPLQVLTQAPGSDNGFTRDIKARFKVRFYGNIMAVDTKHWIKSTA